MGKTTICDITHDGVAKLVNILQDIVFNFKLVSFSIMKEVQSVNVIIFFLISEGLIVPAMIVILYIIYIRILVSTL